MLHSLLVHPITTTTTTSRGHAEHTHTHTYQSKQQLMMSEIKSSIVVEECAPSRDVLSHLASVKALDREVHFQFIYLKGCVYLWVGNSKGSLTNMSVTLQSRFDNLPSTTTLMGEMDVFSQSLAQKLTKQSGLVVFVSYNGAKENEMMTEAIVQKTAKKELTVFLEHIKLTQE